MNDQPKTPVQAHGDPDNDTVDETPEDEFPPLTDPSTIPPDEGDAGHV